MNFFRTVGGGWLLGAGLAGWALAQPAAPPVVAAPPAGRVAGGQLPGGPLVFRGIPYATAARFRAPQPLAPWADVRPAQVFGPHAPQNTAAGPQGDENCLTLNVWTPTLRAAHPRPVVVWVHGGSFTGGSGDDFAGENFAGADSLVAVSVNYRLGCLGFLQLGTGLGPAGRMAGNAGLLDVVAALRWVHANIAAFGGDPARVTVMGESAGAKLVSAVLATPAAAGLFGQVILESGSVQAVRDTATAATVTARLLAALGLTPADAPRLLTLPVPELLRAQQQLAAGPAGLQLFGPVLDGRTLPEAPLAYLARPGQPPLRVLLGTNRDEAGLFMGFWPALRQPNPAVLTALFGANGHQVWAAYERARRTQPADQAWLRTTTDYLYRLATYRLATTLARAGWPVWLYRFDYQAPVGPGPVHAQELGYVWRTRPAQDPPASQQLARQLHQRWVSFIATGQPGPGWPAYQPARRPRAQLFDAPSRATRLPPPYEDNSFPTQAFTL